MKNLPLLASFTAGPFPAPPARSVYPFDGGTAGEYREIRNVHTGDAFLRGYEALGGMRVIVR